MDPHTLAVTLAIAAGWLSFNCLIFLMYYMLKDRGVLEGGMWRGGEWLRIGQKQAPSAKRDVPPPDDKVAIDKAAIDSAVIQLNTSATLPEQDVSAEEMATENDNADENSASHALYVMFDHLSLAVNHKLLSCLQKREAHYDATRHVYSVPGATPQNPLLVTNAYPPGVMPALDSFQQEDNLISGVSVVLRKSNRRRGFDKVQLEQLVAFTQELAALGGSVLDAERKAATSKTFQAIKHK